MLGTRPAGAPLNRYLETWAAGSGRDYAEFCVQYRLTVLMPNELMRMEVRVMWFKQGVARSAAGAAAWTCPAAGMLGGTGDPDIAMVHTVQLASTIWRNQVQQ
jgi:hypothetical protein